MKIGTCSHQALSRILELSGRPRPSITNFAFRTLRESFRSNVIIRMWLLALLGALVCSCASTSRNQQPISPNLAPIAYLPAISGDYFPINSAAIGRTYHIYVRLPEGYNTNTAARYPVIYLLDGDSLFPLLSPTHLFLTYDEKLPEAILVGISYGGFDPSINKRNIDFTAPAADATPGEDGAPRFLAFLKTELIPSIENRYRVNSSRRVLLGQSRGGYFVLWSALEDPDLFWGRIASNAGMNPGRTRFFSNPAPHLSTDLRVAVASGSRDSESSQRYAQEWTGAWSNRPEAPWTVKLFPIQGGTHAASIGEVYRQAMLWLFQGDMRNSAASK